MTSREVRRVQALLAGTDPLSDRPRSEPADRRSREHCRATLLRILSEPGGRKAEASHDASVFSQPWTRRAPRLWSAAAVAAAAVFAFVVFAPTVLPNQRSGVAYAATPPLLQYAGSHQNARRLLLSLADLAAGRPDPPAGQYDYIQTRGWYLDSTVSSGAVLSTLDATERDQWTAADGSGRIEEIRGGRRTDTSQRYGPGGLAGPQLLPTDPAALRDKLGQSHPNHGAFEWLTAVSDVWTVQVVGPALQSGLLRLLAATPDLTVQGDVTDRVGRPGVAVTTRSSNSGLPTDYIMIFNRNTGALLDFEQVVLSAGALHIHVPATISYTVWLRASRVPDVSTRP